MAAEGNGVFKQGAIHEKWEKWIKMLIFLSLTYLWLRKTGGHQISLTSLFCAHPYLYAEMKAYQRTFKQNIINSVEQSEIVTTERISCCRCTIFVLLIENLDFLRNHASTHSQ